MPPQLNFERNTAGQYEQVPTRISSKGAPAFISDRVIERLLAAERRETDVWLRDDYRQARICVSMAARGEPDPFLASSYAIYGTHPDHVWEKLMRDRRCRLGREFSDWFDQAGNLKPDIPGKKPAVYEAAEDAAVRIVRERLAGVLAFPKTAPYFAELVEKEKKGTLHEMPSPALIEARKSLRILPA